MSFFSRLVGNNAEDLREKGRQLVQDGRVAEGITLLQEALAVAVRHRDQKAEGWVRNTLGIALKDNGGDVTEAAQHLRLALDLARNKSDVLLEMQVWSNLGSCFRLLGNLLQAAQCQKKSLELAEAHDNPICYSSSLHNLAGVFEQGGHMDEAMDCYRQRIQVAARLGDARGLANSTLRLATLLLEVGENQEARQHLMYFSNNYGNASIPADVSSALLMLMSQCYSTPTEVVKRTYKLKKLL